MVRQALMYAIDRQSVVNSIIKLNNPNAEVLNCGFVSFPNIGNWCKDVQPFSQFTYDPAKAVQILQSDGYTCTGVPSSPCTKNGSPLTVQYSTVADNTRRTTTQQLLQAKAKAAGFQFTVKNYDAGVLFGDIGPHGKFTVADYATGGSVDPSDTSTLACENIPTSKNQFAGGNWNNWCDVQATSLMHQSDQELDPAARLKLLDQVYQLEAKDFVSLTGPQQDLLVARPDITVGFPSLVFQHAAEGMYGTPITARSVCQAAKCRWRESFWLFSVLNTSMSA